MVLVTNEVASGDFGAFTARLAPASALQCFCRHAFYFTAKHSKSAEGLTAKARRREGEGNQEREAWKSKYAKGFLSLRLIRLSGSFASLASRPRSASAFFAWLASLAGMKFGRPNPDRINSEDTKSRRSSLLCTTIFQFARGRRGFRRSAAVSAAARSAGCCGSGFSGAQFRSTVAEPEDGRTPVGCG